MKKITALALVFFAAGIFARAEDAKPSTNQPPAVASGDERLVAMEKKLMRKLEDMDAKLDRIERDQPARDRKMDQMSRDVSDMRRSVDRLESKR